jgi:uncharacterized protein YoxC
MTDGAQDQFIAQVSESIKDLHDLTTRVDERVKHLIEKQSDLEQKMNKIDDLSERMAVIESKVSIVDYVGGTISDIEQTNMMDDKRLTALEASHQTLQGRWQKISSFVLQLIWAVVACYIIYKLGLGDSMPP